VHTEPNPRQPDDDFALQAHRARTGFTAELIDFLKHSKKWWLGPIVLSILFLGLLVLLSGTAVAPFIYTLF